ncbi:MAG: type II toxin-antitoxin system death-on-curing family toxin [Candidatus Liptonbacteria bacterium]|nr:type II toxin-antitoxin system death-on-curing family toxin [Candidatus Liptonbacteria bacterium]
MEWDEPIPDFGTRFPNILESCLGAPFQSFGRTTPHPGLVQKSAFLFYLMVKNHPFENGNKRIAVMTLLYFLYKNNKWLEVDNQQLYLRAVSVAKSIPQQKEKAVADLGKFIRAYLASLKGEG